MATNFPTSLDSLTNPGPTDSMAVVSHSSQHINANDAIEALEAKVGIDGSAVATSHDYKIAALVTDLSSHVAAADPHTGYVLESNVNDTIEAAIANAPTGTGSVVLSNTPTLTTPNIGAATGTSLALSSTAQCTTLTASTKVTTPLIDTASGPLTLTPASGSGVVASVSAAVGVGFKIDFNESQSGGAKKVEFTAGTGASPQWMQMAMYDKTGYNGGIIVNQALVANQIGLFSNSGNVASFNTTSTGLPSRLKLGGSTPAYSGFTDENVTLLATSRLLTLCQNGDTTYADLKLRSLTSEYNDAATNSITNVVTIGHNTSGTAAAGFGSSLKFQLESSTTADVDCASLQALWDTATHASRKGSFVLTVFNGSTEKTTLKGVTTADNERIEVPIGSTATSGAGLAFIGSGGTFGWERSGDGSWNFFSFGSIHVNVGNGRLDGSGTGICISSQSAYGFSSVSSGNGLQTVDATVCRSMANGLVFGPGSTGAGAATTRNCVNKAVASIADNTATTVFTVTIPNAAHSASIRVRLVGSSGAGGAIGANESTQEAEYLINICRTAGVNAVAAIGAVIGQPAAATVAGGNAVAVSGTISAISGAVGASNTFTIQVTIARAGSTADNHTCLAFAELLNANATGVSIA